jgi:exopolysaccharide biosynthesis predicted pyruvyltransferase EpsI
MPLLPLEEFATVFEPLRGKRIGFVRPVGNVGDDLIELATRQLFDKFAIDWREATPDDCADCDELAFGGGGNMGRMYEMNWDLRTRCLETGLPVTILPQSFTSAEDREFHRVYVRERESLKLYPSGILAPDLALGLEYSTTTQPRVQLGVFLRRDGETAQNRWFRWRRKDPVRMCHSVHEYLELAAAHSRIITDRLHFAICGLILGREVALLGNSYHKNRSLYETWLKPLGCRFAMTPAEALRTWEQSDQGPAEGIRARSA